ncbi:hypothetical protein VTK56DRAFT_5616 [Thermocarpiscus australiensis]
MSLPAVPCPAGAATARRILLHPLRPQLRSAILSGKSPSPLHPSTTTRSITSYCSHRPSQQRPPLRPQQQRQHLANSPKFLQRSTHPHRAYYHSHDHPPPPGPFTAAEESILSAAYKHVPSHGFTQTALALGARDAGYLDISAALLPDGAFSLIRWHLYTQRAALAGKKEKKNKAAAELFEGGDDDNTRWEDLSVADKVEALAWARLRGNEAVVGRWQEALAIMAQPSYVPASLKELALLADEILYLAGDAAVDPSWYTKRASLSAVYAASELFQTTDQSPGFRETRAFLRRRLAEAAEAGSAVRSAGEWLGFTASAAVNVLRSKGLRI